MTVDVVYTQLTSCFENLNKYLLIVPFLGATVLTVALTRIRLPAGLLRCSNNSGRVTRVVHVHTRTSSDTLLPYTNTVRYFFTLC